MCFRDSYPSQRAHRTPMSEKVAVFDPESKDLRRLPRNKIDGLLLPPYRCHREILKTAFRIEIRYGKRAEIAPPIRRL